ncbi:MAG: EAL domain-containing protein [Candidatus Thiodiazotropha sp. (ex Lucina pensylvanica)]|nr:EAL domain-containing protein [Candidatus Thiodiazotropha sp. (ex Lucina pensylvanica)]
MRRRVARNTGRYLLLFTLFFVDAVPAEQPASPLKVGIYDNPPLITTDQSGNPNGLFIDLLREIASREGWELRYISGTWSDNLNRLATGRIDLLPAIAINENRQRQFLFTGQSVVSNWAQIFVPEASTIQSLPDLDGKRIAVLRDDIYITGKNGLADLCRSFAIACRLIEQDSYDRVMRTVTQGEADAGLVNRLFGATRGHFYPVMASPIVLMPQDIRLAISRRAPGAAHIKQRLDHHLAMMKIDELSPYQQRLRTLFETENRRMEMPTWVLKVLLIGGLAIVALLILAQIFILKHGHKSQRLISQEAQYRRFFNGVAIALCEGDSSRALLRLQQLGDSGIKDIRGYFDSHPQELVEYIKLIRIVNANPATLKLFGVSNLYELQHWLPGNYTPDIFKALKQWLIASSEKQQTFTAEISMLAADGRQIQLIVAFPLTTNLDSARHIPVSILDVTLQRETERQLSLVIKGASLGFWDWNLTTNELTVNDRWMEMLGLAESDMNGNIDDWRSRLHPEDRERVMPIIMQYIEDGTPYNVEFRMRHSDGRWIWVEGSGGAVEHEPHSHLPIRACGTHQEISERKRAAETLHTLMQSMVGITGGDFFKHVALELCYWFDADSANIGELAGNNKIRALATILNNESIDDFSYSLAGTPCEIVIKEGAQLYPQGLQDMFPNDEDLVLLKAQSYAGTPIKDLSGRVIGIVWVSSSKPLFMEPDWAGVMDIIAARISAEIERMRAMDQLEHQATFDALTELPNRRMLIDRLGQARARCLRHDHRGAVMFMDLDHFKTINDSLGHNIGDLLLKEVARRLTQQIRDEDTASRLGGDEFVVLFSELTGNPQQAAQHAQQGARKILKTISEPYTIEGNELHITLSIGIVIFPMSDESAEDILKFADTAMYRAKEAGRNTIRFFLPGMQQATEEHLNLQHDLQLAIEENQLEIHFQPIVDSDGNPISAEALLRWQHPQQGIIKPKTIITVAEDSGQILQIGEWMLEQALRLSEPWLDGSTNLDGVAVNINAVQFRQVGFVDQIERLLRETVFNPSHLTLEILENTLAENIEDAKQKVVALKSLGVKICVDSFGIGYASIAYLRQLPLDELKIDRSFVRDIGSDPKDAKLVKTIITMAHQMEIDAVAMGVETAAQLQFLRDNGCRIFQGYYFNHPLSPDEFDSILKQQIA